MEQAQKLARYSEGDAVWTSDLALGFRAATVRSSAHDRKTVEIAFSGVVNDQSSRRVSILSLLPRVIKRDGEIVDHSDCVSLEHLDEANLLNNLIARHARG